MAKQMATADVSSLTAMVEEAGSTQDENERELLMEKILQEADRAQESGIVMSNVDAVTNQICTLICQVLTLKRCFKCSSLEHVSNSSACPKKFNADRSPRRRNRSRERNDRGDGDRDRRRRRDWGATPCINHLFFTGWFPFQFTFRDFSPSLSLSPKVGGGAWCPISAFMLLYMGVQPCHSGGNKNAVVTKLALGIFSQRCRTRLQGRECKCWSLLPQHAHGCFPSRHATHRPTPPTLCQMLS